MDYKVIATVFFSSMLPIVELRGGIPLGIALGMSYLEAAGLCIIGSTLIVPVVFFAVRPIFNFFLSRNLFEHRINNFIERTLRKSSKVKKYGFWGLFLFVGIPLPGTGAWTGTLLAILLDIRFKSTFFAVLLGNILASLIILMLTHSSIMLIDWAR
ncbi:small multi-drug export protein [Thermosyntropha sp.]|uniref:COG2426 family protein n=1 Tax=Thermosyntropha sp. TaxID=2740820 RepID=UPI0025DBEFBB|nr:small multi-drug export protein [Thermosyntropha sp.]MBO8158224.1 small multi-drug export protein [Thermosyntropha sp.]